jgi:hypothetical protein
MSHPAAQVVAVESLEAWFRESLSGALASQKVAAEQPTEHYMVQLLTGYARAENLYEQAQGGSHGLKPLAQMLAASLEAPSPEERHQALRRMGDVSLFIAGFFADSLSCKSVDVDYYSHMGESAYGTLSTLPAPNPRGAALAEVFAELARKFTEFVDVLNEIAQQAKVFDERDALRLYELWLRTGSRRAAEKLRGLGLQPALAAQTRFMH